MQIHSIQLKNIKSHRDTLLNFSPGINVLSGPNGVGKSTVFEAIGYALFGVDAQSFVGNVERFISIGAKRGEINVTFQPNDDVHYRVSRTLGTPSRWLLAKEVGGAFEVEEHKDIKETEGRLKELLGLTSARSLAEQFELVIGPFQHDFLGPFVIRQPTRRRDKFDEILGIDTWRKTYNDTKVLTSTIKAGIDTLESAVAPLQEQLAELPEKRKEYKAAQTSLEQTEAELKTQQQQLQQLEALLTGADQREKQIREMEKEIATCKERISNGTEMIGKQKLLVSEAQQAHQITVEAQSGKKAYEQAEEKLHQLREQAKSQRLIEQKVAELNTVLAKLDERLTVETQTIAKAREEFVAEETLITQQRHELVMDEEQLALSQRLPDIRVALERVRLQLGQLEGRRVGLEEGSEKLAGGICPFLQEPCLNVAEKPAQDVFSAKFSELDQQRRALQQQIEKKALEEQAADKAQQRSKEIAVKLEGVEKQLATLSARSRTNEARADGLAQLRQQRDEKQQQLQDKQSLLNNYINLQVNIDAAEQEKVRHQQARDLFVANQQQAAELSKRREDLHKFEMLLQQLQNDLTVLETAFTQAGKDYDAAEHGALRQRKDLLWGAVNTLEQKIRGLTTDIGRIDAEITKLEQIEKTISAKQEQIKALQHKDDLVKFLRNRVFRHVSGYLSERFREEISRRAGRIYRVIAEADEELVWGDHYRIVLRDMVDGQLRERGDDQLSGGQTMSAVVALRLAMLQTIGARIAFFDEPTSHLDAARRENLAHAFRAIDVGKEEVTEHWYDQLFLISHDVAFTEITDQILTIGASDQTE